MAPLVADASLGTAALLALGAALLVLNAVTVVVYALDKRAARRRTRRVPERTLLALGLIGGWPGALVAQRTLRHKTRKASFRRSFVLTVVLNVAVVGVVVALVLTPAD
ncbi:DUF1294 domain-containing protein [Frigoribacterium sp. NBH87]|uniref:DUF1294 domain-containing protein n=1 Tax=Frigoribacterium sp. NBH87 TaxID=2596916 RepID=UPI0021037E51|nr:DUF1294 domain-containing protein [Frigoribacterium sp. NBH87]